MKKLLQNGKIVSLVLTTTKRGDRLIICLEWRLSAINLHPDN